MHKLVCTAREVIREEGENGVEYYVRPGAVIYTADEQHAQALVATGHWETEDELGVAAQEVVQDAKNAVCGR